MNRTDLLKSLSGRAPRTDTVKLLLDDTVRDRFDVLAKKLSQAKHLAQITGDWTPVEETRTSLDTLLAETPHIVWNLKGIGYKARQALAENHPATDEEVQAAKTEGTTPPTQNFDTFLPALLAACTLSIETPDGTIEGVTDDEIQTIFDGAGWTRADIEGLYSAALELDSETTTVPKG